MVHCPLDKFKLHRNKGKPQNKLQISSSVTRLRTIQWLFENTFDSLNATCGRFWSISLLRTWWTSGSTFYQTTCLLWVLISARPFPWYFTQKTCEFARPIITGNLEHMKETGLWIWSKFQLECMHVAFKKWITGSFEYRDAWTSTIKISNGSQ